eukprot:TRINITY_DN31_c0_g1_i1.p1 TRINITY_DN31_c0_g1~~TRINITY_DN31_c0_g1_i1.p1  ORF type:complete len:368 (-),score=206.62 TRINITY_DN31_c0_g1_i1:76-1179(-)
MKKVRPTCNQTPHAMAEQDNQQTQIITAEHVKTDIDNCLKTVNEKLFPKTSFESFSGFCSMVSSFFLVATTRDSVGRQTFLQKFFADQESRRKAREDKDRLKHEKIAKKEADKQAKKQEKEEKRREKEETDEKLKKKKQKKDQKDEKKKDKKGNKDKKDKKDKKKDKDGKKDKKADKKKKKEEEKLAKLSEEDRAAYEEKKKQKDEKKGKKDKKDKKDKKGKKDKDGKKDKKDKKKDKDGKKDKKDKGDKKDSSNALALIRKASDAFTNRGQSISRFAPCLALLDVCGVSDRRCNVLRRATELQFKSELCWVNYLDKVAACGVGKDAAKCYKKYSGDAKRCDKFTNKAQYVLRQLTTQTPTNETQQQ